MAKQIKDLIENVFAASSNWRFVLLKNWPSIIGPLHTQVRIERMYEGTLMLGVYDAHWMHEFYMLSRVILRKINEHLGETHITKLHFKLIERPKPEVQEVKNMVHHKKKHMLSYKEKTALVGVADLQLREALAAFLYRIAE